MQPSNSKKRRLRRQKHKTKQKTMKQSSLALLFAANKKQTKEKWITPKRNVSKRGKSRNSTLALLPTPQPHKKLKTTNKNTRKKQNLKQKKKVKTVRKVKATKNRSKALKTATKHKYASNPSPLSPQSDILPQIAPNSKKKKEEQYKAKKKAKNAVRSKKRRKSAKKKKKKAKKHKELLPVGAERIGSVCWLISMVVCLAVLCFPLDFQDYAQCEDTVLAQILTVIFYVSPSSENTEPFPGVSLRHIAGNFCTYVNKLIADAPGSNPQWFNIDKQQDSEEALTRFVNMIVGLNSSSDPSVTKLEMSGFFQSEFAVELDEFIYCSHHQREYFCAQAPTYWILRCPFRNRDNKSVTLSALLNDRNDALPECIRCRNYEVLDAEGKPTYLGKNCEQRRRFTKTSKYLLVQVHRFDIFTEHLYKNEVLNLSEPVCIPQGQSNKWYKVRAVICHDGHRIKNAYGQTELAGHYTAYVRYGDSIYFINDDRVQRVPAFDGKHCVNLILEQSNAATAPDLSNDFDLDEKKESESSEESNINELATEQQDLSEFLQQKQTECTHSF